MKPASQKKRVMSNNERETKTKLDIVTCEWRAAMAALHFLTIIPPFSHKPFDAKDLGKSVAYYPIIGGFIGLFLLVVDRLLSLIFPISVVGALLITLWVGVSGALHLDGFLDSCDGILGGANSEDRLRIMKDERVGAFALIGGLLLILIKYTSLVSLFNLRDQALLLSPIISRWGMSMAIVCFPYGRTVGLGKDIKSFADWRQALISTILTVIGAWIIAGFWGILILIIASLFFLGISYFFIKRIPGLTGDSYGAINELVEVLVLLAFSAIAHVG